MKGMPIAQSRPRFARREQTGRLDPSVPCDGVPTRGSGRFRLPPGTPASANWRQKPDGRYPDLYSSQPAGMGANWSVP